MIMIVEKVVECMHISFLPPFYPLIVDGMFKIKLIFLSVPFDLSASRVLQMQET